MIIAGVLLIAISILGLIRVFNLMQNLGGSAQPYDYGYVIGSLIFPLILTVSGRWIYRKGRDMVRTRS